MTARRRRDRGSAELEMVLATGLIMLPIAVLVMLLPRWPESTSAASSTAKEAATLIAVASGPDAGIAAAQAAVDRAQANLDQELRLEVEGSWCRGCTVTVLISVRMPGIDIPGIGSAAAWWWTARSAVRIDDFRSIG